MAYELLQACNDDDLPGLTHLLTTPAARQHLNDLVPTDNLRNRKFHFDNTTSLHASCYHNKKEFVEVLLKNGAQDDVRDSLNNCAIHYACYCDVDALEKVKLLVEWNTDNTCARGCYKDTPLIKASEKGYIDMVEYLIHKGARLNDVDSYYSSALYYAALHNQPIVISSLLQYGANINLSNNHGFTPLHVAAKYAALEAIKTLTASPLCDIESKNNDGKTAREIAMSKPKQCANDKLVIEYLTKIVSKPKALVDVQVTRMSTQCDLLKQDKLNMNTEQCKRCDSLSHRVQELERQIKDKNNDKTSSERDSIKRLHEDIKKFHKEIQQFAEELANTKIKHASESGAKAENIEYDDLTIAKAVRSCYCELKEDLDCERHADFLFAKSKLTGNELAKFRAAVGGQSKAEIFLDFLLLGKKDSSRAPLFLKSLRKDPRCEKSVNDIEKACCELAYRKTTTSRTNADQLAVSEHVLLSEISVVVNREPKRKSSLCTVL